MHRVSDGASLAGGVEEVFAAVGESLSLSCRGNSSLVEGGKVQWTENKHRLTGDIASQNGQTRAFHVTEGSPTLVISKVSAVHAAEYQCSESSSPEKVINNIWLYTLDGEPGNKHQSKGKKEHSLDFFLSKNFFFCTFTQLLRSAHPEDATSR